ncbi:DUF3575 domain-containing protein [Xylanibacter rarus]|jgi:hypothetical protein|uniref:DUF3575 domain-containing protein n=1 Tax=Xylanibacter rarus TaxID=1676614 RepID=UPI003AB94285
MSKKTLLLTLFLFITAAFSPVAAQGNSGADTVYTFRFLPQKDMFYVPMYDNENELARLLDCIDRLMPGITDGTVPVYVDGYCSSMGSEKENLATAAIRSNRVKSELIIRRNLTEDCFVTANHPTDGDYVVVRVKVPTNLSRVDEAMDVKASDDTDVKVSDDTVGKVSDDTAGKASDNSQTESEGLSLPHRGEVGGGFAFRFNLLRWATLTPDLGIEWRISPSWGLLVNGSWTSWSWNDKDRRYALWEVMPEVRYYIGSSKAWYLGAMFKTGEFNYKLSETGRQGDLIGGGLTAGYQLRLGKALALDFGIGLGYLNADFEKYEVIDGVRVRRGNETKDWWGPINAGVTLVWKMR